jgi:uncharacterized protein
MTMNRVLLVTDGIFHPTWRGRRALDQALGQLPGFSYMRVRSLELAPADLGSFSALVLHFHHKRISDSALARLQAFVSGGGGVLAIHAATASFKQTPPYFEILGGRFTGHGKVQKLEIQNLDQGVFDGLPGFSVTDELYLHDLNPGITFHFTTLSAGEQIPVVWTHRFGSGRVCYACPGHTTATMQNQGYQEVLRRGLLFVAQSVPQAETGAPQEAT